jgi:hypothetical protein
LPSQRSGELINRPSDEQAQMIKTLAALSAAYEVVAACFDNGASPLGCAKPIAQRLIRASGSRQKLVISGQKFAFPRSSRSTGAADLTSASASVARPAVIAAELRWGAEVVLNGRILAQRRTGRSSRRRPGSARNVRLYLLARRLRGARDTCDSCATSCRTHSRVGAGVELRTF